MYGDVQINRERFNMAKVILLGAGRVGRVIARCLAEDNSIQLTVADVKQDNLDALARLRVETLRSDLRTKEELERVIAPNDFAVGALPGAMGHCAMQAAIAAKTPYVDISFMPEDPRDLSPLAREAGIPVIYDFGVGPGMSSLLMADSVAKFEAPRSALCIVGGLPRVRLLPWEYEAPFSPRDVIEEYVRPARFKHGGKIVTCPALEDIELFDIPGVGTLEGFVTDGLRSLLDTIDCPNIVEKTLRYPGYAAKIKLLRDSGFLDDRAIEVNGTQVNIREFTFGVLEPNWRQEEGSEEFTAMRISVSGKRGGADSTISWTLLDRTDTERNESSMARTTGFPAAFAARWMIAHLPEIPCGVHPPEVFADNSAFIREILDDMSKRGVNYECETI